MTFWKCERCKKDIGLYADYGYIDKDMLDNYEIRLCLDCKDLFVEKYHKLLDDFMSDTNN